MAFPTLSRRPKEVQIAYEANVIKSQFEAGYEHKRKKFTKTRKKWSLNYDLLPEADRDLLLTHFDDVGEYTAFNWTDQDSVVQVVYYNKPFEFTRPIPDWYQFGTIELQER